MTRKSAFLGRWSLQRYQIKTLRYPVWRRFAAGASSGLETLAVHAVNPLIDDLQTLLMH